MENHKPDSDLTPEKNDQKSGYFWMEIRPDNIIFVEPTGYITAELVERELGRLKLLVEQVQRQGSPVLILVNIGKITKHTPDARSAIKQASQLPFVRGAAYGGSLALGMVMQYLQRSIDPTRAHYFRTQEMALAYLQGKIVPKRAGYRAASWRFITISSLLLLFFIAAIFLSWNYSQQQVEQESKTSLSQKAASDHAELQRRMDVYVEALYGFRGLFNASNAVERNEFEAYFKSLNLANEFPGFSAISFVRHVPISALAGYVQSVRSDTSLNGIGYPKFAIYPAAKKPAYDVVTYAAPMTKTTTFGFDLSSDPARIKTLTTARDSGLPTATVSISFASSPGETGFLVTIPIYKRPLPTTTVQRQLQLFGYVNAVFRYRTLFSDVFSDLDESNVAVSIRDDQGKSVYAMGTPAPANQIVQSELNVGGRIWTVQYGAPTTYGLSALSQRLPRTVLSSGIVSVILLALLLATLLRSRGQAVKLADTITTDLERERNLAIENQHKLEISERALAEEKASVERKVVERTRQLHEAHAQLKASLRGLPFGFLIMNSQHVGVFSNQALSEIAGQNIAIGTDTLTNLHDVLKDALDVTDGLKQIESSLHIVDKECMLGAKYLRVLFIPIIDVQSSSPKADGSVIILEDVTEERALQRSRDEFFSIASHELRTPLTAIRGNASIILDTYKEQLANPQFKQMVTDIEVASERLIEIVRDFLSLSELEQGHAVIAKAEANIGDLVAEVVNQYTEQAAQNKLEIKAVTPPQEIVAAIDSARLRQILMSLMNNALRFTKTGSIIVKVEKTDETVKISITDTGSGIPIEFQHLLFRKFQQASSNILTREDTHSTGLGLYISKLMAELMGGTLYLASTEVNKGSTFVLELPAGTAQRAES